MSRGSHSALFGGGLTSRRRASDSLSLNEARRIAIKAQGVNRGAERSTGCSAAMGRLIDKLGVLQIDSVNVLARAHTLPIYSRLGVYDPADLDRLAYGGKRRRLFEYWGHAASLMPTRLQPLFRWRMKEAEAGKRIYPALARFAEAKRALIRDLRREVELKGPSVVGDFTAHDNRQGGWWGWSDAKSALEWLFWTGQLTTFSRGATFERVYDIPERVLPASVLDTATPDQADAKRALVEHSARALGVGTETCLRDYFRLDPASSKQAIRELVEAGTLREVAVEGWEKPAYLHARMRCPRAVAGRALLGPFDPLIWHRDRAEFLFGARIRVELYTPKHKRTHGYYVLPFLFGDRIVGRVDLKADRNAQTLQALSAHCEPGVPADVFISALADEIRLMACWLGLPHVRTHRKGNAAAALHEQMR